MKKTALIIEDHPIYRDALRAVMQTIVGVANVVAVSSTEEGLVHAKGNDSLSLILLDLGLPGMTGVDAITSLRRTCPAAAVIVVSASEDRREVDAVLRAGATAFVSKVASTGVIIDIVTKVLADEPLESTWINLRGSQPSGPEQMFKLTPRQQETLVFLCRGLSNKEIGLRLGLAEVTVKMHISSILRTLGALNRTQAALTARRFGLYSED
jgi:DNA-binding NarL/FixJ family response regulator